jgi:hypothetical protein
MIDQIVNLVKRDRRSDMQIIVERQILKQVQDDDDS